MFSVTLRAHQRKAIDYYLFENTDSSIQRKKSVNSENDRTQIATTGKQFLFQTRFEFLFSVNSALEKERVQRVVLRTVSQRVRGLFYGFVLRVRENTVCGVLCGHSFFGVHGDRGGFGLLLLIGVACCLFVVLLIAVVLL